MDRRALLSALGTSLAATFAGCNAQSDPSPTATPTPPPTATPTETPSPTPTVTPTATPTPPPTATPPPTPTGPPRHALDERFVVGEGDRAWAYTFHRFLRAERVGVVNREADGTYLIAELTAENLTDGTSAVPIESIVVRGGVIEYPLTLATNATANDRRLETTSLAGVSVGPGRSVRGVLTYDVPDDPSNEYFVRVTPPGTSAAEAAHLVPVGTLDAVAELA